MIVTQSLLGQSVQLVRQIDATINIGVSSVKSITTDASGNFYVAGEFQQNLQFGGINLIAVSNDMYVAKFNSGGVLQWVKQCNTTSGTGYVTPDKIVVDASGNVYVTGEILIANNATVNFANTLLPKLGLRDAFVCKFNNIGTLQWVKQIGVTSKQARGNGVGVDGMGNVFITGYFNGTISLAPGSAAIITNTSSTNYSMFVASYDSGGNFRWVQQSSNGTSGRIDAGSLAIDGSGNVFVTGPFISTTTFSPTSSLTALGISDVFLAKYNNSGVLQTVNQVGGSPSGSAIPLALEIDYLGNVFLSASYFNNMVLGNGVTLTGSGSFPYLFIAKYNNSVIAQWAKSITTTASINGGSLATDAFGNVYSTGYFTGTITHSGGTASRIGCVDIFMIKFNANGVWQWFNQVYNTLTTYNINGISINASNNNVFLGGLSSVGAVACSSGRYSLIAEYSQTICPSTLTPTGTITTDQKASNTVISMAGSPSLGTLNIIPNAASVIYQGGNYVQLSTGFEAVNGSYFRIMVLGGCN